MSNYEQKSKVIYEDFSWMDEYVPGRTYVCFKRGFLSQWHKSRFRDPECKDPDHTFSSAEQYMMYRKAILFGDRDKADQILEEENCRRIKAYGRQVSGFSEEKWDEHKISIVLRGSYLKFSQNKKLKDSLMATHPSVLVEASPWDKIWGVGLDVKNPSARDPRRWRGTNLLGKCLTHTRELLRNSN